MDSQKKGFVLSLQDLCKLKILLNVELFPLKSLAQLPQSMRYRFFRILPVFDRLHYDDSPHDHQFLSDIFQLQDISQLTRTERRPFNTKVFHGNTDNMKKRLIRSFFIDYKRHALVEGCRVDLKEASQFLDCLSSDEDPILTQHVFDYIERCCSCIVISWKLPNRSQQDSSSYHHTHRFKIQREAGSSSAQKPFDNYLVIPSRFEEFLTVNKPTESWSRPFHFKIVVHKVQALISYCHLQGIPYPTNGLSIDAIRFLESPLWNTYIVLREKAIQSSTSEHSTAPPPTIPDPLPIDKPILSSPADVITDTTSPSSSSSMVDQHRSPDRVPCIDPTCPFLQDILSPVEHLEIMSFDEYGLSDFHEKTFDQYSIDAPSFIMHNIVSQENPSLKSIHIDGNVPLFADSFVTLDTVTAFLLGQTDGPKYLQDDKGNRYSLMPPSKPYFIEKLSISVAEFDSGDYNFQFILECHTASISRNVRDIIKCQESTLESISLKEHIGFAHRSLEDLKIVNPEEYCSLVQTTFIDFIQFPQFKSLELDDSPDKICHPLVMAYLSTPATHEQCLAISLKPDARPVPKDWNLGCDIPTNLPESNFEYKSLNLKGKESQVIKHLLSFLHLSLKSFSLSTHHLSADSTSPSTVNIQCFTLHLNDDKFTSSKLDSFMCKNPSLTTFIVSTQTVYSRRDRFHILGFKKIIICLVRLVRKQATLESIILEGTELLDDEYRTKSQSSHISGKQPAASNGHSKKSDFDEEYPAIIQWFPNSVTRAANHDNIDLVMFFYLVQKLDATLTIKAKYRFRDLPSDIISVLVHAKIMIRKVTLNGPSAEQWKDEFSKITKIVEIN